MVPKPAPATGAGLLWLVVRRPVAVLMVVLAVAVFGGVSLSRLKVDLLPDVSYPSLTVRTEYEGAAPIDVEKLITRRLEEQLAVISNLVSYRSVSRAGVSDVILEFEWDTPMTFALQDVREKVAQIQSRLPREVKAPLLLRYDPSLDPIMRMAIYQPAAELQAEGDEHLYKLRRLAEEHLQRKLETITGVAAVRVRGGYEDEWRVELDEDLLKQHSISAARVQERITIENVNVAGGRIIDGDREILVRTVGEITDIDEIENLVVDIRDGKTIRIKDLGRIIADKKERDVITRIEGTQSVEIEIFKEANANIVELAAAVKAKLFGADWAKTLEDGEFVPADRQDENREDRNRGRGRDGGGERRGPEEIFVQKDRGLAEDLHEQGIRSRVLSDQSVFIQSSQDEVLGAGMLGAVLAILVLYAFLRRLSPTLIISVTIPISVLATFTPLLLCGVSLNIMSLGGLALGIGMLVDSAIVVLEAITRRREQGEEPASAAVEGTRSVGMAVLASTLTTVAVFLPIVFVEGLAGEFFRDQSLAVVFSLLASLVAALLFIPMLASREFKILANNGPEGRLRPLLALAPWAFRNYVSMRLIARWKSARRDPATTGGTGLAYAALGLWIPGWIVRFVLELMARVAFLVGALVVGLLVAAVFYPGKGLLQLMAPLLWVFDRSYAAVEGGYRRLLAGALNMRVLVLALAIASFVFGAIRFQSLGVELVPQVHQGEFTIESQLRVGTTLDSTDRVGQRIEAVTRRALMRDGVPLAGLSSSAGVARDVIAKAGEGKHTSKVHVRLKATDDLAAAEERAMAIIRKELQEIPEVQDTVFSRPSLFSTRMALEVEVIGPELGRIQGVASLLEERMRRLPLLRDVRSSHKPGHPELVIRPNRDQMAFHNLQPGDVATLIRQKVQGTVSTRVTLDDRKIDVLVRVPEDAVNERKEIMNLRVNPAGRRPIPLSAVADVVQRPGPAEIRRVGGERAIILTADVEDLDLRTAADAVKAEVLAVTREHPAAFRDVAVRIAGQSEESERSLRSMMFAMAIAVFLVYVVMASQFESLIHPFVILISIPLALVGVVIALEFLAIKLSIVVLIGIILLAGIVVNNAIVLVDCVNQRRRAGLSRDEALLEAAHLRLRPILMTTATTALGLLPMALGLGEGAEIRSPMAVTVIAGLTVSTLLTLVVIPVVYSFLSRPGSLAPVTEVACND